MADRKRKLFFLPIFAVLLFLANSVQAQKPVKLGSIDGRSKKVTVENNGKKRQAKRGAVLKEGDRVQTAGKNTTTILLPDGSVLVVGQKSDLEVQSSPDAQSAVKIRKGMVRGLIKKIEKGNTDKKYKIFVRTKSATFGVRGTDFIVSLDESGDQSSVYTLTGNVFAGKTDEALVEEEDIVEVEAGETVMADTDEESMNYPQEFNRKELFQNLAKEQPGLSFKPKQDKPEKEKMDEAASSDPSDGQGDVKLGFNPNSFEFGLRYVSWSAQIDRSAGLGASWKPWLRVHESFSFRFHSGLFFYPPGISTETTFGVDLRALGAVVFDAKRDNPLWFEFGLGYQYWTSIRSVIAYHLGGGVIFRNKLWGFIDYAVLGIEILSTPDMLQSSSTDFSDRGGFGFRAAFGTSLW